MRLRILATACKRGLKLVGPVAHQSRADPPHHRTFSHATECAASVRLVAMEPKRTLNPPSDAALHRGPHMHGGMRVDDDVGTTNSAV